MVVTGKQQKLHFGDVVESANWCVIWMGPVLENNHPRRLYQCRASVVNVIKLNQFGAFRCLMKPQFHILLPCVLRNPCGHPNKIWADHLWDLTRAPLTTLQYIFSLSKFDII
jgi:hypothetical protein